MSLEYNIQYTMNILTCLKNIEYLLISLSIILNYLFS